MPGDDIVYSPFEISGNRGFNGDKAKGIICQPMPRSWYDYHANKLSEEHTEEDVARRELYVSILADKKPYFMRYIYPDLMKQYNTYLSNTNAKCNMLFRMTIDKLLAIPDTDLTPEQKEFIRYYNSRMPVSMADSVMNRICRRVENALSISLKSCIRKTEFDYRILRQDIEYASSQRMRIDQLHKQYKQSLRELLSVPVNGADDEDVRRAAQEMLKKQFRIDALLICNDAQQLCTIMVDLCYTRESSKRFAWDICGKEILDNLFTAGGHRLTYPAKRDDGELNFRGQRYTIISKECDA